MTEEEKRDIVQEVLKEIRALSQDIMSLPSSENVSEKDRIDDEYLCALSPIGQVWGAFGLGFPGASDGFRSKGYII